MLNNPDVQPNTTINRWIAAIHLFDFKLVHIPALKHLGPNGLSRHEPAEGKDEDNDPEEWIDHTLSLGLWVTTWTDIVLSKQSFFSAQVLSANSMGVTDLAKFPVSAKSLKAKKGLVCVGQYLWALQIPSGLDDHSSAQLLCTAARFFLLNDRLWH